MICSCTFCKNSVELDAGKEIVYIAEARILCPYCGKRFNIRNVNLEKSLFYGIKYNYY